MTSYFTPAILRRALLLTTLPLLLAGCATAPPTGDGAQGVAAAGTAAPRPYYEVIDLAGRLSIQYQQNGSDQAMHGNFTWS